MLGVRLARAAFAPATWPLPPRHATRFYSTPAEATAAEPTPEAATTTADTSQNTPEVKSGSGDKPKPPPLAPLLASSLHNNRKKIKKDSKGRRIVRPVPTDFGSAFTENMITINWNSVQGWTSPIVRPLHSLQLHPGASVLQYAFTCFEGMKAYKGQDGQVRLFRPELNAHRFLKSAQRLALPSFDPQELLKIIHRFVSLERHEVPETRGSSLYLRPVLFALSAPTIRPDSRLFRSRPLAPLCVLGQAAWAI
ncbi:hypothetical protein CDD82_7896 [Ophiocordyceps australis]|uniref:Branched-chain-amino-acid aminotransferase n=1 Tax=Ophiocordyceps australis TaxID=1399860 RepID=A0A2C5XTL2_9HYPO|nr:hypothetical protein CDD82_7896 [Ophiocordyceps australis]